MQNITISATVKVIDLRLVGQNTVMTVVGLSATPALIKPGVAFTVPLAIAPDRNTPPPYLPGDTLAISITAPVPDAVATALAAAAGNASVQVQAGSTQA
jgi:hypothetical protein